MRLRLQGIHPPLRLRETPRPLRHPPIKTLYVINHLRDVERMLTEIPPVMMGLKLTFSYMEMTLSSTVSFPDFLKSARNLMTPNFSPALTFKKLFNIKVLPALSTNIYFSFHFRFLLDPFSALAVFCQSYQDHE